MWFRKQEAAPVPIETLGGFTLGQVVTHKIDGRRMVITMFRLDDGGPKADIAFSAKPGDTAECSIYEFQQEAAMEGDHMGATEDETPSDIQDPVAIDQADGATGEQKPDTDDGA